MRDVSFLIDFLPSFLYPTGRMPIVEWGVAGMSLGGHTAWIALVTGKLSNRLKERTFTDMGVPYLEPRVKTGISIIGCPDYLRLMTQRAVKRKQDVEKCFPATFKEALKGFDPASVLDQGHNPFTGKQIQILSGKDDKLVPWKTSQEFVEEKLDVGVEGVKEVKLYDGIGHECCDDMVEDMASFIAKNCL